MRFFLYAIAVILFTACTQPIERAAEKYEGKKAMETELLPRIQVKGETPQPASIKERMAHHNVPGVSVAVTENGKIKWAEGYGVASTENDEPVTKKTIFQAASISKPITALGVLKLVEQGKLNLDTDVDEYLSEWNIPENPFTDQEKVTLRRLLSHTAGTTVHGFPGYDTSEEMPSTLEVLNGEGNTAPIVVDTIPGSTWRYSGGGYTIVQQVISEVSGKPFAQFMNENVLEPLGMEQSTFTQPLPEARHKDASRAFKPDGTPYDGQWHNYPEKAAAGLWTTPTDLAKYCNIVHDIYVGNLTNGFLKQETVKEMLTEVKNDWGIGPALAGSGDSLQFRHGGKNAGYSSIFQSDVVPGNSVIIMTGADHGVRIYGEMMQALSKSYDWNFRKPRVIERFNLAPDSLQALSGKYRLNQEEDYFLQATVNKEQLMITDSNDSSEYTLTATSDSSFIDLEEGLEFTVTSRNPVTMDINGNYKIEKIEE